MIAEERDSVQGGNKSESLNQGRERGNLRGTTRVDVILDSAESKQLIL